MTAIRLLPLLLFLPCLAGCGRSAAQQPTAAAPAQGLLRYEDVAEAAGVRFALGHGGRTPLTILETAGGGAAWLDFDVDGLVDAFLVGPHRVAMFRNLGDGRFADVTDRCGLDQRRYWQGCAAGDYDGDGRVDLLLTGYDRTALYRNTGRPAPAFEDASRAAGMDPGGWTLSGAFGDYDRDGGLDLYVTRYLRFDKTTPQYCKHGGVDAACGPELYEPQIGRLYRNLGSGRFRDVTRAAGVHVSAGKSWAALFSDFTADGYPDLYVANDMMPCDLFVNRRGRFEAPGPQAGVAYDVAGHLQGAMGCDSGDYNNDGRPDLLVGTFFSQATSLYENDGNGFFREIGTPAGIGAPTQQYVKFGTGFLDVDNDGWLDVFMANGHVLDSVRQHDPAQDYRQPLQLLRNLSGHFSEVSASAGAPFQERRVGRGAAFADYDRDGKVDILVCDLEGKAMLLRNRTESANHWIQVRLRGRGGNRQGLGAWVTVEHGGRRQVREIRTCGSVMSANDPVAHFGLGPHTSVDRLTVRWPDGSEQTHTSLAVDRVLVIDEGG